MHPPVDVRLDEGATRQAPQSLPRDETPCFPIQAVTLTGEEADRFQFALEQALAHSGFTPGRCLGAQGINHLMSLVQNAVIARGYTTTRILAAPQDLKRGQLELTVIPGRIHSIRFDLNDKEKTHAHRIARFANELPAASGDILNLRDLEQALENLKRVPTAEADLQIVPAEVANASDIVIRWQQRAIPFRLTLNLDDAGARATGRYQGGLTVSADNPLGLSDLFYVSWHRNLGSGDRPRDPDGGHTASGTYSYGLHYSIPFGRWLLALNHGAYRTHQAIAGMLENYDYNGKSHTSELDLTRLLYRDAQRKSHLGIKLWRRESRNYIDDAEIDIQHRRTVGWTAHLEHKEYLGPATVHLGLAYRRGTGAGQSLSAPEKALGEGTRRMKIITAEANLHLPFTLGKTPLAYEGSLQGQWNQSRLVLQDRFSLGGRYTVRGFDGETTLAGERGWLWRNTLGVQTWPGHQIYLGADRGQVSGATRQLPGRQLTGAVVGLKGQFKFTGQLYYDLFVGGPLRKPRRFETEATTVGFTLNYTL